MYNNKKYLLYYCTATALVHNNTWANTETLTKQTAIYLYAKKSLQKKTTRKGIQRNLSKETMKALFILICIFLAGLTTASKVTNPTFMANNLRLNGRPTEINFGATVTNPLGNGDTIMINIFVKDDKNRLLIGVFRGSSIPITVKKAAPRIAGLREGRLRPSL